MTDWNSVVREHKQLVWHTVYRLVGNDADALDCFQETFLDAVKVDRKEPVDNWPALLRHLATARALDLLRVRYRQRGRIDPLADLATAVSLQPGPSEAAEAIELANRLRRALTELTDRQAQVFCLCRLEGLTYREVAEQMELDTNSIGVLLHRAVKLLQQRLASKNVVSRETK